MVLAADIGGTNARFQVWGVEAGCEPALLFARTYPTAVHPTFESCLAACLADAALDGFPNAACFAVAGPVLQDACKLTNVPWTVAAAPLRLAWSTTAVRVINDFEAVGYSVTALRPGELIALNDANPVQQQPIAVLGPGTGLGQALLTWDTGVSGYTVWPSEGAHADFAPIGEEQQALAAFAKATTGEAEVEKVCCGDGLTRIYAFYAGPGAARLHAHEVASNALDGSCALCVKSVDMFLSILGAEAANLGLKALARGGIFIAGGIPPKLMPIILSRGSQGPLQLAFRRPGCRFEPVRASMPLNLLTAAEPGLRGALALALRELEKLGRSELSLQTQREDLSFPRM